MSYSNSASRPCRVCFRVSHEERLHLDKNARQSGYSISDYARRILLGAKPPRKAHIPAIEKVLLTRILAKIGAIASTVQLLAQASQTAKAPIILAPATERDLILSLHMLRDCSFQIFRALGRKIGPL